MSSEKTIQNRMRKHQWYTFRFDPDSIVDYDYSDKIQEMADKWSNGHHVPISDSDMANAVRFLFEQVNSRAEYDWSGRVDLSSGTVRIPMLDVNRVSNGRYTLTKNGISSGTPDELSNNIADTRGVNLSKDEMESYIKTRIGEWIRVAALYSGGGLADSAKESARRN